MTVLQIDWRLTLGCPGRRASCSGRGTVGAPHRVAPGRAVSPTWGCPTPALPAQSCQGKPCLLACPLHRPPASNWPPPPPPTSFLSHPPPAWLPDRYLQIGCNVSLALACFVSVSDAQYLHFLSPAGVVADATWSAVLSGLKNQSPPWSDDKGVWKAWVCVCVLLMHADLCSAQHLVWMCVMCHSDVRFIRLSGSDGRIYAVCSLISLLFACKLRKDVPKFRTWQVNTSWHTCKTYKFGYIIFQEVVSAWV